MIRRLRNRFIRIAMLSVSAVMLLLTVILNVANYVSTDADLKNMLTILAENDGHLPSHFPGSEDHIPGDDGNEPGSPKNPESSEETGRPAPPAFTPETPFATRFFVLSWQEDGTLLSADLANIASITEDDVPDCLAAVSSHREGYGYYQSFRFLICRDSDGNKMAIFLDAYQELRSVRSVLFWSLLADAACILLVLLFVVLLSRRAIDPVVQSMEKQKQFITDASHELKTPITVIATSLRVLEMETGKQKWIDKSLAQTDRLTQLVGSLVQLSRMDEETSPLVMADFSFSEAAGETADSFREFAKAKGHELEARIPEGLSFCGDEAAIRQLLCILLDNAVKYALPDSPILLQAWKERKYLCISCSNRCAAPVSEEDLPKLFDRFYRADPSRNSKTGGFGIGLSLARSIAEGHRGSIRAAKDGDSITFTVRLRSGSPAKGTKT